MEKVSIICSHCGFTKDVDRNRIPQGRRDIKCPQCHKVFSFELEDEETFKIEPVENESQTVKPTPKREAPNPQHKFCSACGQQLHPQAEICPSCGVRVTNPKAASKVALLLMTFFLGGMGGHKFYQKKYLLGILYLVFSWTYIPSLVALVEFIIYAVTKEEDLQRKYPETASGVVVVLAIILPLVFIAIVGILAAIAIPQFAMYRQKAFDSAAKSDLMACRTQVESYHGDNFSYPTDPTQFSCEVSGGVALYFIPNAADEYLLVSYHEGGQTAYLLNNTDTDVEESLKEDIIQELRDNFGYGVVGPDFHFVQ